MLLKYDTVLFPPGKIHWKDSLGFIETMPHPKVYEKLVFFNISSCCIVNIHLNVYFLPIDF